jgi:uncharacterized protein (UPF0333 family)
MQEKRNIKLLASLVVLIVITIVTYFLLQRSNNSVTNKKLFRVDDFSVIDKVTLSKENSEVELAFDGARWKVNGHPVDASLIDVLFATLQQAEPKRPVATALKDSVETWLKKDGVVVSLYQGNKKVNQFLAGGNSTKSQAFFKDLTTEQSYYMVIPGYRVYVSGIFELDEAGWRDKYVFGFNWRNFKKLTASFPHQPTENFDIEMGKEYFEVKGMAADTAKLNSYLDAVSLITVIRYLSKKEVSSDSLAKSVANVEITVEEISGKTYTLQLYQKDSNSGVTLGLVNDTDAAWLDSRKIHELLKSRSWFLRK